MVLDFIEPTQEIAAFEFPGTVAGLNRMFALMWAQVALTAQCRTTKIASHWSHGADGRWIESGCECFFHGPPYTEEESDADWRAGRMQWVVFLVCVLTDPNGAPILKGDISCVRECEARWLEFGGVAERLTEADMEEVARETAKAIEAQEKEQEARQCLNLKAESASARLRTALVLRHGSRSTAPSGSSCSPAGKSPKSQRRRRGISSRAGSRASPRSTKPSDTVPRADPSS